MSCKEFSVHSCSSESSIDKVIKVQVTVRAHWLELLSQVFDFLVGHVLLGEDFFDAAKRDFVLFRVLLGQQPERVLYVCRFKVFSLLQLENFEEVIKCHLLVFLTVEHSLEFCFLFFVGLKPDHFKQLYESLKVDFFLV